MANDRTAKTLMKCLRKNKYVDQMKLEQAVASRDASSECVVYTV
jgi:hypothetical protein